MFCAACGLEDTQSNQFCRACGSDLRPVRIALETPDHITASAISARDEIGRAVAAKIRETQTVYELKKVAEDVLPEIEKFLESPEEKRLRRLRLGITISSIGFGATLGLALVAIATGKEEFLFLASLGATTFFIGLGFLLNGFLLTVPKKRMSDRFSNAESQRMIDTGMQQGNDLSLPETNAPFLSVTEHTTKHLRENEPASPKA